MDHPFEILVYDHVFRLIFKDICVLLNVGSVSVVILNRLFVLCPFVDDRAGWIGPEHILIILAIIVGISFVLNDQTALFFFGRWFLFGMCFCICFGSWGFSEGGMAILFGRESRRWYSVLFDCHATTHPYDLYNTLYDICVTLWVSR